MLEALHHALERRLLGGHTSVVVQEVAEHHLRGVARARIGMDPEARVDDGAEALIEREHVLMHAADDAAGAEAATGGEAVRVTAAASGPWRADSATHRPLISTTGAGWRASMAAEIGQRSPSASSTGSG